MSQRFCHNCGAPLPDDAGFCPSCGTATTPQPEAPEPPAAGPPASASEPPPPTAAAPSAPVGAPAAPTPPSGAPGRGSGTVIAIVVAAIVLLAGGGGLAYFLTSRTDTPPVDPDPTVTPNPTTSPVPTDSPPPEPPSNLADALPTDVGPFVLSDVGEYPEGISLGAVEAVQAVYDSAAGQVGHLLMLFDSPEGAEAERVRGVDALISNGLQVVGEEEVPTEGAPIRVTILRGQAEDGGTIEWVVWANGSLSAAAFGGEELAIEFFKNVPY